MKLIFWQLEHGKCIKIVCSWDRIVCSLFLFIRRIFRRRSRILTTQLIFWNSSLEKIIPEHFVCFLEEEWMKREKRTSVVYALYSNGFIFWKKWCLIKYWVLFFFVNIFFLKLNVTFRVCHFGSYSQK